MPTDDSSVLCSGKNTYRQVRNLVLTSTIPVPKWLESCCQLLNWVAPLERVIPVRDNVPLIDWYNLSVIYRVSLIKRTPQVHSLSLCLLSYLQICRCLSSLFFIRLSVIYDFTLVCLRVIRVVSVSTFLNWGLWLLWDLYDYLRLASRTSRTLRHQKRITVSLKTGTMLTSSLRYLLI